MHLRTTCKTTDPRAAAACAAESLATGEERKGKRYLRLRPQRNGEPFAEAGVMLAWQPGAKDSAPAIRTDVQGDGIGFDHGNNEVRQ